MTIQLDAVSVPYKDFVLPGHRIISSTGASRESHLKMLKFADQREIRPWVEIFTMNEKGLEQASGKLEAGQMSKTSAKHTAQGLPSWPCTTVLILQSIDHVRQRSYRVKSGK